MILQTALEIIDRDGADGLSMRRLARALDRDPMILYRHAPNKAALLDGVAETVLAQLTSTPPTRTGPASCGTSPAATARSRWPTRTWCRCWSPGRWPPRSGCGPRAPCAPWRTSWPCSPAPGSAARRPAHLPGPVRLPARPRPGRAPGTHRATPTRPTTCCGSACTGCRSGEFPLLRGLAPVLAAYDGAAELERGLDILLTGLTATLTHHRYPTD